MACGESWCATCMPMRRVRPCTSAIGLRGGTRCGGVRKFCHDERHQRAVGYPSSLRNYTQQSVVQFRVERRNRDRECRCRARVRLDGNRAIAVDRNHRRQNRSGRRHGHLPRERERRSGDTKRRNRGERSTRRDFAGCSPVPIRGVASNGRAWRRWWADEHRRSDERTLRVVRGSRRAVGCCESPRREGEWNRRGRGDSESRT
jgi:hypothetical protein